MLNELLGAVPLADVGLSTIVILIIIMILTDRLVTRKRLEECRQDGDAWREVALKSQEVNAEQGASIRELLSFAQSTDHALRSIQAMGAAAFAASSLEKQEDRG